MYNAGLALSCLSSIRLLESRPAAAPEANKASSSSSSSCSSSSSMLSSVTAVAPLRRQRGGLYLAFVALLALVGATTSHSKVIEFICKRLGSGGCEAQACPLGERLQHKPFSRPEFNGCGTAELKINLASSLSFSSCCNLHDVCYGSCGRRKAECDDYFLECMINSCKAEYLPPGHHHQGGDGGHASSSKANRAFRKCVREARLYYHGVVGFGCIPYRRAQRRHCECRPVGAGPATYVDGQQEDDLHAHLHALVQQASAGNRTKPRWEEFL